MFADFKIITKVLKIENEEFALCRMIDDNRKITFVTIPYKEIDEKGRLKRTLNGFDLCLAYNIESAIKQREHSILIKRFIEENPESTENEIMEYIANLNKIEININK